MRQTISGLVAAIAVVTASAVPAMACGGGGLFQSSCSPCGQAYVEPCAQPQVYVAPAPTYEYSGCNTGCGGWAHERLPDPVQQYQYDEPVHQYYYVNQGPTYTGPGNFAPYPTYQEGGWGAYRHRSHYYYGSPWRMHHGYRYQERPSFRYGYAPHRSYAPRYSLPPRQFYAPHRSMRYGAPMEMPRSYGQHERMMREHMRRYN
jgi:hypothetical protein